MKNKIRKILQDAENRIKSETGLAVVITSFTAIGNEDIVTMVEASISESSGQHWSEIVKRGQQNAEYRQMYAYVMTRILCFPTQYVGKRIYRDHTAVVRGAEIVQGLLDIKDPKTTALWEKVGKCFENV